MERLFDLQHACVGYIYAHLEENPRKDLAEVALALAIAYPNKITWQAVET